MSKGYTDTRAEEDGERMAQADEYLPEHRRLVFRKKGYLAGWSEISQDVGSNEHHLGTIKLVCSMIREDGDNPADFEFRIDKTPPVKWIEGGIIDGARWNRRAAHG